jgi:uncharacterized membrane protein
MATIKECDRCGYQQKEATDYRKVNPVQLELHSSLHDDLYIKKDLCTNCTDELKKFMNERLPQELKG